jgi:hypothetical protein
MNDAEIESRFPALVHGVVTERHANICRTQGHARHSVDGVDTGSCPRCGDVTEPAKLCRKCHGSGVKESSAGGHGHTEECRHCAGTGEES